MALIYTSKEFGLYGTPDTTTRHLIHSFNVGELRCNANSYVMTDTYSDSDGAPRSDVVSRQVDISVRTPDGNVYKGVIALDADSIARYSTWSKMTATADFRQVKRIPFDEAEILRHHFGAIGQRESARQTIEALEVENNKRAQEMKLASDYIVELRGWLE